MNTTKKETSETSLVDLLTRPDTQTWLVRDAILVDDLGLLKGDREKKR